MNTVSCKWVFSMKYKVDGSIDRFKVRLVAPGFTQIYGIDYTDTFTLVAKLNTIRVFLSLTTNLNWPIYQLDIKNEFLNENLEEEVYMTIPSKFSTKLNARKVCKLKKSLYELKQSRKAWFDRFGAVIRKFGYIQGRASHSLFHKRYE